MGFQRDNIPLAESRGRASGGVWDSVPQTAAGLSAKGELKNSPVDCFFKRERSARESVPLFYSS